jgi:hypothetical protein
MSAPLVVVGAGGFGRETLDVVEAVNRETGAFELLGVLDDSPSTTNLDRTAARGIRYLGTVSKWLQGDYPAAFLIAVGNPSTRRVLARQFESTGHTPATAIHPRAVLGSTSEIGRGSIICSGVQVSTNVRVGAYVHLNPSVTVGHDAVLADYVSVNPSATISGECHIGEGALLGAASVILQGLTVGCGAIIGASACVVRDVADAKTVIGVPAK